MNIYSVLDDSDNEEQQTKVVVDKKAKDTAKPAAAGAKKDVAKPVKAADSKGKESAQPKPKTAPVGADKPKSAPVVESAATDAAKDNNRGGLPRGKEYREKGGRGGRGGEATEGERRPKRDFDRRSSTGRGRGEASKGGRGSFGLGNPAQEAQNAEKDPNSAEAVVDATEGAEESVEPEVFVEPEPTTFTLDQFMEKRNEARRALLANETKVRTVDQTALAGLSRKEDLGETTYMPVKASKADASRKDQRSTGKNQVLDVAFKFAAIQVDDDRGGRGGRGEGRGGRGDGGRGGRGDGRGRGAGRGESRGPNKAPAGTKAVFSNTDFPSL